jgi:hypothetical protein
VFSIEEGIWGDQAAPVLDAVVRSLGQSREAIRRVCTHGREFWDERQFSKGTFGLEMHLML